MAMIKGGLRDIWAEDEADIRDSEMEEEHNNNEDNKRHLNSQLNLGGKY